MHRPAERFAVNLQDPIGAARHGSGMCRAPKCGLNWLLLPMALALGLAAAWLVHVGRPAGEPGRMTGELMAVASVAAIEPAHGSDSAAGWLGDFLPVAIAGARSAGPRTGWPVILQRASDGAFYAEILVSGAAVHARIDPEGSDARLAAAALPAGAVVENDRWHTADVELQHLRLPPITFHVAGAPAETVLGMAGLAPAIEVEATPDRLRVAPTRHRH